MATKSVRIIDPQGRIIIPNHIRSALNVAPGNLLEVVLDDDNTIRVRPVEERCAICGKSVEDAVRKAKLGKKSICYDCCQSIAREMMK